MEINTVVFDVNETLLDLAALDSLFEHHLGSAALRKPWFGEMLVTAMTLNHIGCYETFTDIGRACLATTAARAGVALNGAAVSAVLDGMRSLPPHADVIPALERLRAADFRLATLTNSPPEAARAQLEHAGIATYFADQMTVAEAGVLKPAGEVYEAAAGRLGVPTHQLLLVAAHTWDLAGAAHAGWRTAFVARGHQIPHPLFPAPALVSADLDVMASGIVAARNKDAP